MKKTIYAALGLSLATTLAYAQTLPSKPAPAQNLPAQESLPINPGDKPVNPGDKPLQDPTLKVSPSERRVTADFARMDANADGKLSRDEAKTDATLRSRFKSLDVNGDGSLSEQEMSASGSANGNSGSATTKRNKSERSSIERSGFGKGLSA